MKRAMHVPVESNASYNIFKRHEWELFVEIVRNAINSVNFD